MSALAAARNTPQLADASRAALSWKMKGSTTIYKGSLVALNGGYAAPMATATARIAVGRALATVVNAGADGAAEVPVEEGIFKWANDGGDPIVAATVGGTAYGTDDQTVSVTSTGKSVAGKVVRLDSDGVWVKTVL
jgi:hypothetical protein